MRTLLTIIPVLLFCVYGCNQSIRNQEASHEIITHEETELKQTIDTLIKEFAKYEHRENTILIEGKTDKFNTDSLYLLLKELKKQDVFDKIKFKVYKHDCEGIEITTWKARDKQVDSNKLVKYVYQSRYTEDGRSNDIKITDYELYSASGKRAYLLRVVNDSEFEQLSIGAIDYKLNYYEKIINHTVYKPVVEQRLLGLDEIEIQFENKRLFCQKIVLVP